MKTKRNYNKESRNKRGNKYFYGFDLDVMHPFMFKSFLPFFIKGNMLELGSFEGEFTSRLIPHFKDITCVEASDKAISKAKEKFGKKARFICSTFEEAVLPVKYDNIILTHTLEHIDNPTDLLKKIRNEWLSHRGRLFLACPNGNAASRQIAVKMGLVSHNTVVTPSEKEYGHRRTYTLKSLEKDTRAAGLKTIHKSGIFFKALANFQWDKLLKTGIISPEYLDGCFQLGKEYPDLCSSIFLICEKGK